MKLVIIFLCCFTKKHTEYQKSKLTIYVLKMMYILTD
jgi:hypothetical protein